MLQNYTFLSIFTNLSFAYSGQTHQITKWFGVTRSAEGRCTRTWEGYTFSIGIPIFPLENSNISIGKFQYINDYYWKTQQNSVLYGNNLTHFSIKNNEKCEKELCPPLLASSCCPSTAIIDAIGLQMIRLSVWWTSWPTKWCYRNWWDGCAYFVALSFFWQ